MRLLSSDGVFFPISDSVQDASQAPDAFSMCIVHQHSRSGRGRFADHLHHHDRPLSSHSRLIARFSRLTTGFSRVTDVFGSQAQYLWIANSFIFPSSVFIGRTEVAKGLPDAAY